MSQQGRFKNLKPEGLEEIKSSIDKLWSSIDARIKAHL